MSVVSHTFEAVRSLCWRLAGHRRVGQTLRGSRARPRSRVRLTVQPLEPRIMLSSSLSVDLTSGLFKVEAESDEEMDITLARDGADLVVVDHAVDQPRREGVFGRESLAQEAHLRRPGIADLLR